MTSINRKLSFVLATIFGICRDFVSGRRRTSRGGFRRQCRLGEF